MKILGNETGIDFSFYSVALHELHLNPKKTWYIYILKYALGVTIYELYVFINYKILMNYNADFKLYLSDVTFYEQ